MRISNTRETRGCDICGAEVELRGPGWSFYDNMGCFSDGEKIAIRIDFKNESEIGQDDFHKRDICDECFVSRVMASMNNFDSSVNDSLSDDEDEEEYDYREGDYDQDDSEFL